MNKLIYTYGIIAGLIVSAMVSLSFVGIEVIEKNGELFGYSSMIIAFSTIFIAINSHKTKFGNNEISFKKAFSIGLKITLIASAIYIISWFVLSNTIAQDFMTNYFEHSIESIRESNLSASEIETKIAEVESFRESYKNPLVKIGMTFIEIFPVGLLVSLIAAFILRTKK